MGFVLRVVLEERSLKCQETRRNDISGVLFVTVFTSGLEEVLQSENTRVTQMFLKYKSIKTAEYISCLKVTGSRVRHFNAAARKG